MVKYFANRENQHMWLFCSVMDQELRADNVSPTSLFREESVGVRLWGAWLLQDGSQYFQKQITQIQKIIEKVFNY